MDLWFYRMNVYLTQLDKAANFATAIRKVLYFAKRGKGIYVHCAGGCDRTGALCAIIEGLCCVSENDICKEYELSERDRSREMYRYEGGSYDGDFKFAMAFIKGLNIYNGHIYTKCQCWRDSYIVVDGVNYNRSTHVDVGNVTYYRWKNGDDYVFTLAEYPMAGETLYVYDDGEYVESELSLSEVHDTFWYDAQAESNQAPKISDATLLANLEALSKPSLQKCFELLMKIPANGLSDSEIYELRQIFVS